MGENNTIQSISSEFVRTIQDVSQYLTHQRALGNGEFTLSPKSLETINAWGKPRATPVAFRFQGPENARLFFVDSDGVFFAGESGALLVKILAAMGMTPESVFICNAVDADSLHTRIQKNRPKIVIALGQRAGQLLLNLTISLEQFQGKFHSCNGIQVMPTFHPVALLAQPGLKRKVWEDMQQVMQAAGLSQ
jgi:uracil-DNA glycosylase